MKNKKTLGEKVLSLKKIILINIKYENQWIIHHWHRKALVDDKKLSIKYKPLGWDKVFIIMDKILHEITSKNDEFYEIIKNNDYSWELMK